jgi:murein DD-endopeptidase MepM/ murein hydrolase activator NlpD
VRFTTPEKLERVQNEWDDRRVQPSVSRAEETHQVLAMLGSSMNTEPGARTLKLSATIAGQVHTFQKLVEILPGKFPREALTVAPKMNNPPEKILKRIRIELAATKKALRTVSLEREWEIPFHRPVEGIMLSRFGLRRTYNNETKRRHTGLDFRAPEGTPIAAIAAGRVVLVGAYYLPGNTVVIDHGNGVVSMSSHLSDIQVAQGDPIARGQIIGHSGSTGRVTGSHLHLSVSVQGVAVDPEPLFELQ